MSLFSRKSPTNTDQTETGSGAWGVVKEIFDFTLIALLIVVPIRMFVAQPFIVSGASMENTFDSGQYLIVDQVSYKLHDPHRGDVIVFRYPKDPSKFFIKRVIGLPGETVLISGNTVTIKNAEHPDGLLLDEPYIKSMRDNGTISKTLAEDEYFVMGDNRDYSSDSRVWGTLTSDKIIGRAYLRLLPLQSIDYLPGVATYEDVNSSQ